jgi:hypothetical protein
MTTDTRPRKPAAVANPEAREFLRDVDLNLPLGDVNLVRL